MEQKEDNKKKMWKVVIWAVVILAFLGTMHILVNYFDMFEFLQKLHGG
jgi:formate/nitrite transporter FocA (FNT family)